MLFIRNPNCRQLAGPVEPGELAGITSVGLDAIAGTLWDEGGGDDVAMDSPPSELPVQRESSWPRLVAGPDLSFPADSFQQTSYCIIGVGNDAEVQNLSTGISNSTGDGICMDIETEISDISLSAH